MYHHCFQRYRKLPFPIILLLLLFFLAVKVHAQQPKLYQVTGWPEIEAAIKSGMQLRETLGKVQLSQQVALENGDAVALARSLYNSMLIKDKLTEDSLYFRNSAFIDSLLTDPGTKPLLKSIMHIMQAKRLNNFEHKNLKFKRSNYQIRNLGNNYAALNGQQLDSVALVHLNQVILLGVPHRSNELLWLSAVPETFLFQPSLQDLAITQKIYIEQRKSRYEASLAADDPTVIAYPDTKFMAVVDSLAQSKNQNAKAFAYYRQWHNTYTKDPEKQAYIATCIRQYYHGLGPADSLSKANYLIYLQQQSGSAYQTVRAAVAFQLFNHYLDQGNQYQNGFKASYRNGYTQALQVYAKHQDDLNAYQAFKRRLPYLLKTIKQQQLEVYFNDVQLPNAPLLLQVKYKQVPKLHYRIIKVNHAERSMFEKDETYKALYQRAALLSDSVSLPDPADHQVHAVYLKLPPLPIGTYYLLFAGHALGKAGSAAAIAFQVSNMAPVNADQQLFVLDRKSGLPLKDVKVTLGNGTDKHGKPLGHGGQKQYTTTQQGTVKLGLRSSDQVLLVYGSDTLAHRFQANRQEVERTVYDKEEYDDLEDFYDTQARLMVYTDRGIYRPGQHVHFKAILFSRHPKTGEQMIFSKQAGKVFKQWLKNNGPKLNLVDAKNRTLDSLTIMPDDYGSFSGTFTLPKTAITGQWAIESDWLDDFYEGGHFAVEEYKRPTFEMALQKPEQQPTPGKPFQFKLKVNSLSGANLGKVTIKYRIERSNQDPTVLYANSWQRYRQTTSTLVDTLGLTNAQGELDITINDSKLQLKDFDPNREWQFDYRIQATAIEDAGEQVTLDEGYSISTWPLQVSVKMEAFYEKAQLPKISPVVTANGKETDAGSLDIAIYQLTNVDDPEAAKTVDEWLYPIDQLRQWFPDEDLKLSNASVEKRKLVFTGFYQKDQKFALANADLAQGSYELVLTAKKEDQLLGRSTNRFRVFDNQATDPAVAELSYLRSNLLSPGDSVTHYLNLPANTYLIYGLSYYNKGKQTISVQNQVSTSMQKGGLLKYRFKVPATAAEKLVINYAYVHNNQLYRKREEVQLYRPLKASPEIIVEKYRKVMAPGAKETFSVSIKTANRAVAAQLMTTIYDAALDQLEKHNWAQPKDDNRMGYLNSNWTLAIRENNWQMVKYAIDQSDAELWQGVTAIEDKLMGFLGGAPGLNEQVVVRGMATGSVITLRGNSNILDFNQPLVIVDGVVYPGSLKAFDSSTITEGLVLKAADATAIYGARAAQGVLVLSTKGKIVFPMVEKTPVLKVRKDFSETAVFVPKIYADKNGLYTFSFTMPQSTTAWNWKMLAHTKTGVFAYAERKLNTQLNLMVQPHLPRLLYQGDELVLQSRILNMDTLALNATTTCTIEDAVTGQDLSSTMGIMASKQLNLAAKANAYAAFTIKVPQTQVNPLKIVVTVRTANAADAEEHIIPVMSKQIFVKQSSPFQFATPDTLVKAIQLPTDAQLYGIGLSIAAKPQAALLNALPWLANYTYDCAEQTFNKMLAHITALRLMQQDQHAQALYQAAKQAQATKQDQPVKNTELPAEITQVVSPWLNLHAQQAKQQNALLALLDTAAAKAQISTHLQKIYALQNADGGIPWFVGGKSNVYISNYLLAGFGKLDTNIWAANQEKHMQFIQKLLSFTDQKQQLDDRFDAIYAKSFWKPLLSEQSFAALKTGLNSFYQSTNAHNLKTRLLMALATKRLFAISDPLYAKAKADLESIRQMAIHDPVNGLRWKAMADQDNLDARTEEMIALFSEAFANDQAVQQGLLQWLMGNRQEQHWSTTTGTAAAINMLSKQKDGAFATAQNITAKVGDSQISTSDDLLSGKLMDFGKTNTPVSAISLSKSNAALTKGSLTWYYFAPAHLLNALNTGVKLEKRLQVFVDQQQQWVNAGQDFVFKTGMRVKVLLSIETQKALSFVQLSDYRAAAFEPADQASGQRYQDGISFYQSVRDTGYQFFTEFVPSGKSELSYELKVVQEGTFVNGPAVLSCMYKPEIAAYSNAFGIKSVK